MSNQTLSDSPGAAVTAATAPIEKIIDNLNTVAALLSDDPADPFAVRSGALLGALRSHLECIAGDGNPQAVADNIALAVVAMADHSDIGAAVFDAINAKIAARLRVA
jgi:hypothetical protein